MEYQENPQSSLPLHLSARELAMLKGFRQLDEQAKEDVERFVNALQGYQLNAVDQGAACR